MKNRSVTPKKKLASPNLVRGQEATGIAHTKRNQNVTSSPEFTSGKKGKTFQQASRTPVRADRSSEQQAKLNTSSLKKSAKQPQPTNGFDDVKDSAVPIAYDRYANKQSLQTEQVAYRIYIAWIA
jgi:hypothetical protein